ncbi:hypothetical protein V1282_001942 [Nitrobacteraceae bacterium AZCC 2146]
MSGKLPAPGKVRARHNRAGLITQAGVEARESERRRLFLLVDVPEHRGGGAANDTSQ